LSEQTQPSVDDPEITVLRKVMWRLVPFLALAYAFNIIDRGNVSTAALQMNGDLHLSDKVFSTGYGIFFVSYFIFEVPSNLIMERVGARWWIARIMLSWGLISSCMMFVHTPIAFYSLRFLLGIAEAGFYPGIVLYITYWVPAKVRARVMARFLSFQAVIGLVGFPLAALLFKMNGIGGLRGWQWLFLMEGLPSIILSIVTFRTLPDRPEHARWLTDTEKSWIADVMLKDSLRTEQVEHITWRTALREPRVVQLCLIFLITSIGGNCVGAFAPQILKARSHGTWSDSMVAFVFIIPAVVGAIAMSVASYHSDRTGHRRAHIVTGYLIAGLTYIAYIHAPTAWWLVAAFSLNAFGERIAAGSYWAVTANTLGLRAAAGGIAMINSTGNLGGFFGPKLMAEVKARADGSYVPGFYIACGLVITGAIIALLLPKPPIKKEGRG
jgi:ACS family tartrate transporter-like MFS transporter